MDLFGERLSGRAGHGPGGGAGGVVVQGERGVQVRRADLSLTVGERVGECEADDVCFGAGGNLAQDAGLGLGELVVGLVPELSSLGVEADVSGGLGAGEGLGEQIGEAGGGEGVVVAAFGEQALTSAGDDQDAVEVAV